MSSQPAERSVVQHQDLIGLTDAGGTLGDEEGGNLSAKSGEGFSERGVCGEIQRAGAVIEDQYFRIFDEGPGDGETLLLAAG